MSYRAYSSELTLKTGRILMVACLAMGIALPAGEAAGQSRAPVFEPVSKSYFQLFDDNKHPGTWAAARQRAESKVYKGIRGRLAHVDTPELHSFLVETFRLDNPNYFVWIGLRYWCKVRMLQWTGQRAYSPTEPGRFKAWLSPWEREADRPGGSCGMSSLTGYTPVFYRSMRGIVGWQATGSAKFYDFYMVEYPAGETN